MTMFRYIIFISAAALVFTGCSGPSTKQDSIPVEQSTVEAKTQQSDAKIADSGSETIEPVQDQAAKATAEEPAKTSKVANRPADPFAMLDDSKTRGARDLVIVAVGDVSQPAESWVERTDAQKDSVFDPTRHLITGDLNFMNLESPVTDLKPNAKKTYAFTSPPGRLDWYMGAGFNMFSLSNNHIADADQPGIDDTIRNVEEYGKKHGMPVYHAGAGQTPEDGLKPTYIKPEGKDVTVAFIALGFSKSPNVGKFWDEDLIPTIKEASTKADIVYVSVHAGKEYEHIPPKDLQNRYRSWVDAGADLVIGHHTHCIQPMEQYKDGLIFYSLGNYVFSSRTVRHRKVGAKLYGMMARIVISDGAVYGSQIVPLWVNNSEDWKLESGEVLPNANFIPQVLTGPFADAWFNDFDEWTKKAGATPVDRVGDVAFYRMKPYTREVAFVW